MLVFAPGRYELRNTALLKSEGRRHLTLSAATRGTARLSGGVVVRNWTRVQSPRPAGSKGRPIPPGLLWVAPLPEVASGRQLWMGESRASRARHPSVGYLRWRSPLPPPFEAWGLVYERGQVTAAV